MLPIIFSVGCNNQSLHVADHSTGASTSSATSIPTRIEYSDWSLTLSRVVHENEVDLAKLTIDPAPLDAFLKQAAALGPRRTPGLFPDDTTRLAFLINLHNANTLAGMLAEYRKHPDDYAKSRTAPSPPSCAFDGRHCSVTELRAEIRRLSNDDWRVPFALFDGRRDGPPLWPQPILPDGLDAQLTRITQSALKQTQIVFIDHARHKLQLWYGLYAIRSPLIAKYQEKYRTTDATVLSALLDLADADRRAELNTAIGYPIERMAPNAEPAVVKPAQMP